MQPFIIFSCWAQIWKMNSKHLSGKRYKQKKGQKSSLLSFTHTRLLSMASIFFGSFFFQFSQKFCNGYEILNAYIPILNFFNNIFFEVIQVPFFLKTLKPNKEEMANIIEFYSHKCVREFFFASILRWSTLIFLEADVITVT
jgi:hypothetical protein